MLAGIYNAGSGVLAAQRRQEVVSENLANANVPGFRRMFSPLQQVGASAAGSPTAKRGVVIRQVARDFQPGLMEPTGNPLDVAIEGDGFFVVNGPHGPLYTRSGVMQLDADGQLVTSSGFAFEGVDPLSPDISSDQIVIGPDGTVSAGSRSLGQLQIVQFDEPNHLVPVGAVYFAASARAAPSEAEVTVRQGVRELSNVNATEELIQMIVGMRHHEASLKSLNAISEAIQQHTRSI